MVALLCACTSAAAQVVTELVKDINAQSLDVEFCNSSSNFPASGSFDGEYYICINTLNEGQEVWVSDGTLAGTRILKDINPGTTSSNPRSFTEFGGAQYFTASTGTGLWVTDGTEPGTVDVDFSGTAPNTGGATNFTVTGNTLFFTTGGNFLKRLHKTDGTVAGSQFIKAFGDSTKLVILRGVTAVDDDLYLHEFQPISIGEGSHLLQYYDSSADTVVEISSQHSLEEAVAFDNRLFFRGFELTNKDPELWVTDGTLAGTVLFKDTAVGAGEGRPTNFNVVGDQLYFSAVNFSTTPGQDSDLWKSDGTEMGTVFINPAGDVRLDDIEEMVVLGDKVIFIAERQGSGLNSGAEIWVSDGTESGTFLLKDINPGATDSIVSSFDKRLVASGGFVYFPADDGTNGEELWRTDGTTDGTVLVKDIMPGADGSELVFRLAEDVNGTLFFVANDGSGQTIWKSDGTAAGTVALPLASFGTNGAEPKDLARIGNEIYFSADNGIVDREPWISDGTNAGTRLLADIAEEGGSVAFSRARGFTQFGGLTYFAATDNTNNSELWVTDGTALGTQELIDLEPGVGTSSPDKFTPFGSIMLFTASANGDGIELWKTDGSAVGTVLVKDINPLFDETEFPESSRPDLLTPLNGSMMFVADDGVHGFELWKTDGTTAGTVLVKDIRTGENDGFILTFDNGQLIFKEPLVKLGSQVLFPALADGFGVELWASDGTTAGTQLVKDINGSGASNPRDMIVTNSRLYFAADDDVAGDELWTSDGTEAGTVLLKDIQPGAGSSQPSGLVNASGKFFFAADDGVHGRELFVSRRTAGSTNMVKDIVPGIMGSDPTNLIAAGDYVLFTITDENGQVKLWHSDGTTAGTQPTKEFRIGQTDDSLDNFLAIENVVYYTVNDGTRGDELYKTVFPDPPEEVCFPIAVGNQKVAVVCL